MALLVSFAQLKRLMGPLIKERQRKKKHIMCS